MRINAVNITLDLFQFLFLLTHLHRKEIRNIDWLNAEYFTFYLYLKLRILLLVNWFTFYCIFILKIRFNNKPNTFYKNLYLLELENFGKWKKNWGEIELYKSSIWIRQKWIYERTSQHIFKKIKCYRLTGIVFFFA